VAPVYYFQYCLIYFDKNVYIVFADTLYIKLIVFVLSLYDGVNILSTAAVPD